MMSFIAIIKATHVKSGNYKLYKNESAAKAAIRELERTNKHVEKFSENNYSGWKFEKEFVWS